MEYHIESRWPKWSRWIHEENCKTREEAEDRVKKLRAWNEGEFKIIQVDYDPPKS